MANESPNLTKPEVVQNAGKSTKSDQAELIAFLVFCRGFQREREEVGVNPTVRDWPKAELLKRFRNKPTAKENKRSQRLNRDG